MTKEEEDKKTKKDLIEMVDYKHREYSIVEIIDYMDEKGYENVGKIIEDALLQSIFSISKICDDGTVMLELSSEGEDLWDKYNRGKEGYFEEEIKKFQWKCSICNYQFDGDATPPEKCPSCGQTCSFIDATCYIPECKGPEGRDRRI